MKANYSESLRRVLVHEGGYSNDAHDSGGPTNYGITIGDVRKYIKPNATADDVRALRPEQADAIYRSKYWNALRCDDLPSGVDYAIFDFGVNSGPSRAAKYLQGIVGSTADGIVGPRTLAATSKVDPAYVVTTLCDRRLGFLRALSTWQYFGRGWSTRVAQVRSAALVMAKSNTVPPPPDIEPPHKPPPSPPAQSGGFFISLLRWLFWR